MKYRVLRLRPISFPATVFGEFLDGPSFYLT